MTFVILLLVASCVYLLIQSFSQQPGKTFTSRDWQAFEKAKQIREDLKKAEGLVGPPKLDPDHTYTMTIKDKKPES